MQFDRRSLLAGAAGTLAAPALAQWRRSTVDYSGNGAEGIDYRKAALGAGGWVTGGSIADEGTLFSRTDTYNAFVLEDGYQRTLMRPGVSVALADVHTDASKGGYEVACQPTNSSKVWVAYANRVFRSENKGLSFTKTNYTSDEYLEPNNAARCSGPAMAVDPANGSFCLFGAGGKTYWTQDNGATFPQHASLPVSVAAVPRVLLGFDRTSAVTGGRTQGVYAFVEGIGLHHSINGGTTFKAVTGGPTTASYMHVRQGSARVYLTGYGQDANS